MNPLTAAWISTIGHVVCATLFVAVVVWVMVKHDGKKNDRWFS